MGNGAWIKEAKGEEKFLQGEGSENPAGGEIGGGAERSKVSVCGGFDQICDLFERDRTKGLGGVLIPLMTEGKSRLNQNLTDFPRSGGPEEPIVKKCGGFH